MASRQQIKARINSVRNTRQITKAMEMVSAARMRRAQEMARKTRPFYAAAQELLAALRQQVNVDAYSLFVSRPISRRLLIVISGNRGLAGAYDSNIARYYINELKQDQRDRIKNYTVAIGKKIAALATRTNGTDVIGVYANLPEHPTAENLQPVVATALDYFLDKKADAVDVIYTHSYSSIRQEVEKVRLLPAGSENVAVQHSIKQAVFEPSAHIVLRTAARRLVEVQTMQMLLEAIASEHSMRMLAMKNATDNASELIGDYTLAYNNARQSAITQELAEITGGAEALSNN